MLLLFLSLGALITFICAVDLETLNAWFIKQDKTDRFNQSSPAPGKDQPGAALPDNSPGKVA